MKREDVFSVKIYFVKPVDLIAVVINTLLELEYETYTASEADAEDLLKILPRNQRSIVLLSVSNKQEIPKTIEYARKLQAIKSTETGLVAQVGAFVYSSIDADEQQRFLYYQIPTISFAALKDNSVQTLDKILTVFDARGMRRYVRVKSRGVCVAFVKLKGRSEPLRCVVSEISAYAMLCQVDPSYHHYFAVGSHLSDVMLTLRGIHIRTAVKVLGFSRENSSVFILKLCGIDIKDGKMVYTEAVPADTRRKIHTYVRSCLKEEIEEQLAGVAKGGAPKPAATAAKAETAPPPAAAASPKTAPAAKPVPAAAPVAKSPAPAAGTGS
jgi:hypothetical protein